MSVSYELYLNFLYSDVLVCFPFCWVWLNFALTKYQWNCVALFVGFVFLCDLFVGFSLFHLCGFVFLSLFVFGLCGFHSDFLYGHVSTDKLCIAMLLWVSIF